MPHALYLPVGTEQVEIEALTSTCEVAVCGARATRKFPAALIHPSSVEVEIRGGGNATRQINHILKPDFPADRLLVVEVYTPSGNWSSYPPHKHDVHNPPGEVDLDEIYFYKISQPEGYAIQRVYTRDGRRDETLTVRDNEVVLIPDGYHPVVAAHGYDCYYLNVLAGSARSMAASRRSGLCLGARERGIRKTRGCRWCRSDHRHGHRYFGQDWLRSLFRGAERSAPAGSPVFAVSGRIEREHGGRACAAGGEGRHRWLPGQRQSQRVSDRFPENENV